MSLKHFHERRDWDLLEEISSQISLMLEIHHSPIPDNLIGIEERVKEIEEELDEDVLMVVIHGMGGIGKTTLASAVFDRIRSSFQFGSFLSNVRELSKTNGIVNLQKSCCKMRTGSLLTISTTKEMA